MYKGDSNMAYMADSDPEGISYVRCPVPGHSGCDYVMIVRGYCTIGQYCIRDCIYAWLPKKDNA